MTHTFCFSFFSFVNSVRLLSSWFHTFILLTRTFILQKFFQSLFTGLYGAFISFCSCPLHARYVYFSSFCHSRNVMFLALTWFNFFLVFCLLRALSNLFLSAICYHHCDFYNYVLTSFQNNATFTSILMWITIGHYWGKTKH